MQFRQGDCQACEARALCTRAKQARYLRLPPREQHTALEAARARFSSDAGRDLYKRRAGIEGTLSQGVRAFGLRRTRYRGLAKTHLQHVAIAAAINVERLVAWFTGQPRAATRTSRAGGDSHPAMDQDKRREQRGMAAARHDLPRPKAL